VVVRTLSLITGTRDLVTDRNPIASRTNTMFSDRIQWPCTHPRFPFRPFISEPKFKVCYPNFAHHESSSALTSPLDVSRSRIRSPVARWILHIIQLLRCASAEMFFIGVLWLDVYFHARSSSMFHHAPSEVGDLATWEGAFC
jgi:hypothetical protein